MNKYAYEIFDEVQKLEEREDRIARLKELAYTQIKTILAIAYNPNIELSIPKGVPPYEENADHSAADLGTLFKRINEIRIGMGNITQFEAEKIYIGMLEKMHPEDAKIFIAAKDGNLVSIEKKRYSKMTKSLVEAAFPEILKIGEKE